MHDETPACIEFDDACVKRGGHVIWQHGTFSIPQGSVTAIVGTCLLYTSDAADE